MQLLKSRLKFWIKAKENQERLRSNKRVLVKEGLLIDWEPIDKSNVINLRKYKRQLARKQDVTNVV